jgi:hypothetical protein
MTENTEVEIPTPSPDGVTVLENTTVEKPAPLTAAQQKVFDAAVKEAMGRAGKLARQEAEQLRVENQRLKDAVSGTGSADELERTKGLLAEERLRNQAVLDASVKQQRDLVIAQEASKHGFVDASTLQQLTRQNLRHNTDTGAFDVVDESGNPRLNAAGEPLSVTDFFADYGNKKPYLVRGSVVSGTGQGSSLGSQPPAQIPLEKLFGRNSDSRLANEYSKRNGGRDYKLAKLEAQKRGLI